MNKKYFMLKLNPNRPGFSQTMTPEEKSIMQQHVAYWKDYLNKGVMLIFGPVIDPKGTYGLGIVSAADEKEVDDLIRNDPASKINKYEYFPMLAVTAMK